MTLTRFSLAAVFLAGLTGLAGAQEPVGTAPVRLTGPEGSVQTSREAIEAGAVRVIGSDGTSQSVVAPVLSDVERYCTAIADPAREARNALQTERLTALESQIDTALDELETKRAEYEEWLAKRQAFLDSASAIMLDIYAAMRPDAAAAQLAGLDREAAASIIANLKSRQASAIMSEMPAPVAAELAGMIVERTDGSSELKSARAPVSGARS